MEEEKYKDALKYFTSSLDEFEIVKDERLMAQYYLKRAIVYYVIKDYDNAHNDLNRSLENSLAVDDKNLHSQGNLYGVLNEIGSKKPCVNNALKLFKEFDECLSLNLILKVAFISAGITLSAELLVLILTISRFEG